MSAIPGWYPDPASPSRLRLWDGNGWTLQTSEPAAFTGMGSGPISSPTVVPRQPIPTMTPRRPPPRRRSAVWLIPVAAVVVGVALVVGIVWSATGGHGSTANTATGANSVSTYTGPGCPNPVPDDASPAAVAYLYALDAARPNWSAISAKIYADHRIAHVSDMAPQVAADGIFLTALRRIQFPAADVPTADQLMNAVAAYRNLLLQDENDWPLYAQQTNQRQQITDLRSAATARLRVLVGLPQSNCGYWRP